MDSDHISVLVVDDEQGIRDGSERILSRMGFDVRTAGRGDEGLEMLQAAEASIVLLDLKMPGMDGMEVLRCIRERYDDDILVIVITGFATIDTAIEAMKCGAYDFIPKPFEPDQLRIVVNRARERLRLTLEAKQLAADRRRTLADLDTEKSRIHTIIESLPNGVVVTNAQGEVVLTNPAFRQYLNIDASRRAGDTIDAYVQDTGFCQLVMDISRGRYVDYDDIPTYEFNVGADKYLLARGRPVLGEKRECLGAVVNLADITTIKVLDRLKSEFVAKVSHELRSPLSTIHEQLAVVLKDVVGEISENEIYILSRAKEKTQGLISLIGDLLDLSRIEAGNVSGEIREVHVDELLRAIVDFLKSRADAKEQSIELLLPATPLPTLHADSIALESIFGNLITNAIIYTPKGGRITIKAQQTGLNLQIMVSDNGFGIASRHIDKIFDRFYRIKDENTRFITGTGLGLPIVKGLVDGMEGSIHVDSTPGEGSTFTVTLPLKPDAPDS